MRSAIRTSVMAVVVAGALAAPALATPINTFNTRPVAIGPSGEPTLQSVLNSLWGAGTVNAVTDQNAAGVFAFSSSVATSIPTMVVEYAGNASTNVFGIWFGTDTSNIATYDLMFGPAHGGSPFPDAAAIQVFGNQLLVNSGGLGACGVAINCGLFTNPLINANSFGFYLRSGSQYFFTADQLNAGGGAYALAFNKPHSDTWTFAFEDVVGGDHDFQDMVVKVESIGPAVPEPASLLLLGSGLLAMRRRRRS